MADDDETTPTPEAEPEGDTTVVVVDNSGDPTPEAEPEGGDTTVVVVEEEGNDEGAQDDATNLDHEQRITRVEDGLAMVAAAIAELPTRDEVREMVPSYSEVIDTAAVVAEEVVADTLADDATGDPEAVRVEEPAGDPAAPVIVSEEPNAPEATGTKRRPSMFTW